LQVGTHGGQDSISVAVDVASNLMAQTGVVMKFTTEELRDSISKYQCGCRGQSRKFNSLNTHLEWKKEFKHLKVPIINLNVFSPDMQTALIKCKLSLFVFLCILHIVFLGYLISSTMFS